jgi:hypothetical protein
MHANIVPLAWNTCRCAHSTHGTRAAAALACLYLFWGWSLACPRLKCYARKHCPFRVGQSSTHTCTSRTYIYVGVGHPRAHDYHTMHANMRTSSYVPSAPGLSGGGGGGGGGAGGQGPRHGRRARAALPALSALPPGGGAPAASAFPIVNRFCTGAQASGYTAKHGGSRPLVPPPVLPTIYYSERLPVPVSPY